MKYIKQFLIILVISFAGELCKYILPFPIPASIYGMAIMFTGLMTGLVKLEDVRHTGKFLIEIMPIMFIPAGVGLDADRVDGLGETGNRLRGVRNTDESRLAGVHEATLS